MRVQGPRSRVLVLLAAAAALAAGGAAAYPRAAQPADVSVVSYGATIGAGIDAATQVAGRLTPPQVRRIPVSRSKPSGRDIPLFCPTNEAPGCALSFIRNDTGWRIHPLYGYHSCHTGIDLRGRYGAKVHAAAAGTVIAVIHGDPAYGNVTLIQHDAVLRTMYAHQSRISVHPGQRVWQGEVIGRVGSTGFATGPHLHFEVHVSGRPYDPAGWFGGGMHPIRCYPGVKY